MLPTLLAWFYVIFPVPQPAVNWAKSDAVHIVANGREELLDRCLSSGIEVTYRFELRMCRKRSAWFDDCESTRKEIHSIQFDPVSESYKVEIDRHGDEENPEVSTEQTLAEAISKVSTISELPLLFLTHGVSMPRQGYYVGVRVITECNNSFGNSLLDISSLITFGLVKINRFDSGWIAFDISPQQ